VRDPQLWFDFVATMRRGELSRQDATGSAAATAPFYELFK
jgi:hypothetical protein